MKNASQRRKRRTTGRACRFAGAVGLIVLGIAATGGRAPAASIAAGPGTTETFSYVGKEPQKAVVPAGVDAIELRVLGGDGGTAFGVPSGDGYPLGAGAQVKGRLAVSPGQVLTVYVGGYGGAGARGGSEPGGPGGWGGTGAGGSGGTSGTRSGGGGGGSSMVTLDGRRMVVAGGGGGAGGGGFIDPADKGGPGGGTGPGADAGSDGKGPGAGKGGGGADNGDSSNGGNGGGGKNLGGGGGGGGSGVVGGSGGTGSTSGGGGGGGGGGGSSFVAPAVELATIGRSAGAGFNGEVSITWEKLVPPRCAEQTVGVPNGSSGVSVTLDCAGGARPGGYKVTAGPTHGRLEKVDLTKGTFTYVPAAGFAGTDSMSFVATAAGQESATTTVTFAVPPRCIDEGYRVGAGGPGVPVRLRCAESNDPGTFRLVSLPDHGFLDERDLDEGTFRYVPAPGYTGADTVRFENVVRGHASQPATVTFNLVSRPYPSMDLRASAAEVPVGKSPTLTLTMPRDATGAVGFYDFDQPGHDKGIGVAPLVDGVARLTVPTKDLQVGVHHIQASSGEDNLYVPNDSNVVTVTVRESSLSRTRYPRFLRSRVPWLLRVPVDLDRKDPS